MDEQNQKDARLLELEEVDKEILLLLTAAASCLTELGKDKSVIKNAEAQAVSFIKKLDNVDKVLAQKIQHLGQISSGGSHEGTHYDCAKNREIVMRCSADVENYLAFLSHERNKYLASLEDENQILDDGNTEDLMES